MTDNVENLILDLVGWVSWKQRKFENAAGTTFWSVDVANGEYDAVGEDKSYCTKQARSLGFFDKTERVVVYACCGTYGGHVR